MAPDGRHSRDRAARPKSDLLENKTIRDNRHDRVEDNAVGVGEQRSATEPEIESNICPR